MLNAVMLVKDRRMLTQQALKTFFNNSQQDWTLTVVDDGSDFRTQALLDIYVKTNHIKVVRVEDSIHNTAMLRNLGVYFSEHYYGRGEYLYLSDNDAYFTPGWDTKLVGALAFHSPHVRLLGPYRHPYHLPNAVYDEVPIAITDAVQGLGHLMTWETWDKYGPQIEHKGDGQGTLQSEDYHFCRKIVEDDYLVGSIQPDVVYHCGLTGTEGKPTPGAEITPRIQGVYYE